MLPVCSTAPTCCSRLSSPSQFPFNTGTKITPSWKSILEDGAVFNNHGGAHLHRLSVKSHDAKMLQFSPAETLSHTGSVDPSIFSPYPDGFDDIIRGFSNITNENESDQWSSLSPAKEFNGLYHVDDSVHSRISEVDNLTLDTVYVGEITNEFSNPQIVQDTVMPAADTPTLSSFSIDDPLQHQPTDHISNIPFDSASFGSESMTGSLKSINSNVMVPVPRLFGTADKDVPDLKENLLSVFSGTQNSLNASIAEAESAAKSSYRDIDLYVNDTLHGVTKSFDNSVNGLLSYVENTKELAGYKMSGFLSEFKDNMYKASGSSLDVLRKMIVFLEDALANTIAFVVYSFESTKTLLPVEAQNVLNASEKRIIEFSRPLETVFHQVYNAIDMFARSFGFDPNDPLVPFVLFLGSSTAIGISLWNFKYGGYSGSLSPERTFELLKSEDSVVLIDVRPEDLREKEGVPDLRRETRFRYASIVLPKVDNSVKKQLMSTEDIDSALLAVAIRNMKSVQSGSTVIIMDAFGDRSKGIARSLTKLGIKTTFLMEGGFRSWIRSGLRVKELKPESPLSILNEEAEALLEDIMPSPALAFGYCLGALATVYSILEWERTLQFIGIFGLGQTLYKRVVSYEDSEDFKKDMRLLLSPVRFGAGAFYWVTAKVEPNKIGLPTSPSSTAVQDRVLQAAAKHASQPSDEIQPQSVESASRGGENLDVSEAL